MPMIFSFIVFVIVSVFEKAHNKKQRRVVRPPTRSTNMSNESSAQQPRNDNEQASAPRDDAPTADGNREYANHAIFMRIIT